MLNRKSSKIESSILDINCYDRAPFNSIHLSLVAEDAADEFEDHVEVGEEFADEVTD